MGASAVTVPMAALVTLSPGRLSRKRGEQVRAGLGLSRLGWVGLYVCVLSLCHVACHIYKVCVVSNSHEFRGGD